MLYFNLGTVFGERIYEVIKNMKLLTFGNLQRLEHEESLTQHIEKSLKALNESGQEENLGNLKGELFERLMFSVLHKIYWGHSITHSYSFSQTTEDGKKEGYEYDYLIETNDEFIVIELKGYKGEKYIKKGEYIKEKGKPEQYTVKWFFNWTYQKIKNKFKDNPRGKHVRGCYITTARFDDDALAVLEKINKSSDKPQNIDAFYDGKKLIELLDNHGMYNEIEVIKKYYKPITGTEQQRDDVYEAELIEIDEFDEIED